MAKRFLMPLLAAIIIAAMVIPGCAPEVEGPFELTTAVEPEGAGTVSITGTSPFEPDEEVPVQATANEGWSFDRWTATAGFFEPDAFSASATFIMPSRDATITANFVEERTEGFWLDYITIEKQPLGSTAILRLQAGDYDVYAHTLDDVELFEMVEADPDLYFKSSIGSFNTMRPNTYGPEFTDGMVNPFYSFDFPEGVRTMNEVFNKFIDREFIASEIMAGLAWPRYTSQHTQLADYARYYDDTYISADASIAALEDLYEYDPVEGMDWLNATMAAIDEIAPGDITGSADDGWLYDGEPIRMIIAIRDDDPIRDEIGDYVVAQLRTMGFDATPFKGDMAATLSGLANVESAIQGGDWSMYTGGWVSTVLARDSGYWFLYFNSPFWEAGIPAFKYLEVPDDYYDAAWALAWLLFTSFEERDALYEIALPTHMKYGMIQLTDTRGFSPLRTNVDLAADGAGGIYGSWTWALTAHFRESSPVFGGHMRVGMHDLLVEPWNPIAGSNTVYDMFPIRATGDMGTHPDPRDGLRWDGRIDRAEVTITEGLPAIQTNPWVTLDFEETITAPDDAWRAWDWETQSIVTVAEALADPDAEWGLDTAVVDRYSVAYFPEDIWDHPLHCGSPLSYADFLYGYIIPFDRGQGEDVNPMFDSAARTALASTYANTIGIKFTVGGAADDFGLKVETWSKLWEMDAERMVTNMYPNYAQGNGYWHTLALGIRGERAGEMAFGELKGQPLPLGWINFLNRDVQLGALVGYLDGIRAATAYSDDNVPYYEFINAQYGAAGLGSFAAEVDVRMDNLKDFVGELNHLWVGAGPYYLDDYSFALNWVRLAAFEAYPDERDRWFFLLEDLD